MAEVVALETVDRTLLITLDRPERRNAINRELAEQLLAAVERLDADPHLRCGVVTGRGSSFCAGMDLASAGADSPTRALFRFVREGTRKPLIAAVDGPAYAGGLEIALTCDMVVASTRSTFAIPETARGLVAAAGGLMRLPAVVGTQIASYMALTGEPIDAAEAHRLGLVTRLVDEGTSVVSEALSLAGVVARNSPLAVRMSRELMAAARGATADEYWTLQKPHLRVLASSPDLREGAEAFLEKRAPDWVTDAFPP